MKGGGVVTRRSLQEFRFFLEQRTEAAGRREQTT